MNNRHVLVRSLLHVIGVHLILNYFKICDLQYSANSEVFFMFLIINSILQYVHANKADIDIYLQLRHLFHITIH